MMFNIGEHASTLHNIGDERYRASNIGAHASAHHHVDDEALEG
jgi:hypothetical protein